MHSGFPSLPANETLSPAMAAASFQKALDRPTVIEWSSERSLEAGIYGFDSIDPRSRSFNLIRGRLLEMKRQRQWRLIGVVSATPDVGKSFVSANVGASLSRDPRVRTYAVDLDLRRGSLSHQFGIVPTAGVSDHLATGSPLESFQLDGQKLVILPTLGSQLHSAELLASARAQALFQAMQSSDERNIFLCDLPPVFANDDAVATMVHLDGYILVAEEGQTTESEIGDAVDALGRDRLAGVILNKFRGGVVSDGYGVESYYAAGYGGTYPGRGTSD